MSQPYHVPVATVSVQVLIEHKDCYIVRQGKDMFRLPKRDIKEVIHGKESSLIKITENHVTELQLDYIK
jgi:hypothetical protein